MKKWIIKQASKQKNNEHIYRTIIQKTMNMMKIMTKMLQKRKNYETWKFAALTKNIFSGFLNWMLGHLQSSDDENKIAIREISIRAIQKLSYCDQQTIVGGPNFNLTNGKISIIFPNFFVHSIFAKIAPFFFNFDWFPNYFDQKYIFSIFYWFKSIMGVPFLLSPFGGFR